jgi:hypothetical protein
MMNNHLKVAIAVAIIGATAFTAQAQTNRVERLGFTLTLISQGEPLSFGKAETNQNVTVVRMGTEDVINVLGAATTNTFSTSAQLLRITPIVDGTNGPTMLIVKDKTNIVDVTGFLTVSTNSAVVTNTITTKGVLRTDEAYSIKTIALVDKVGYPTLRVHFSLQGFVARSLNRVVFKDGLVVPGHTATWTINGPGDRNDHALVIDGSVTVDFDQVSVGSAF